MQATTRTGDSPESRMRAEDARAGRQKLAEVARLYYLKDVSKVDIGRQFGVSRFKVARMLAQARELGVVSISIQGAAPVDVSLSRRLSQHWGINAVVVKSGGGTAAEVRRSVGEAAAELFMDTARDGDTVGLTWGRTLTAMTDFLTRLPKVTVVQLTGAVTADLNDSPVELVRKTSLSTDGAAYPIIAPAIIDDQGMLAALRGHPDVRTAIDHFDDLDLAILAVGSWNPPASQLRMALPEADRVRLDNIGVRAEVAAGVYFDDDGFIYAEEFSDRYLSVSAEQLRRTPRVIAAAGGLVKLGAVAAVVKSGMITDLVTDHTVAEAALLREPITPMANPDRAARACDVTSAIIHG